MELRDFAIQILSSSSLEDKLYTPPTLTDHEPGIPLFWKEPERSVNLRFKKHTRKDKLPTFYDHKDPFKRAECLHRFAGHELLAVEIMAFALLAFPDAPKHFRKGVAHTLIEEQEHVRLYIQRLSEMGMQFGDLPLFRNFWSYTPHLTTPEKYLSIMSLTFEMANLDFAPHYGLSFLQNGDELSAKLMARILEDEIAHVSFGLHWLNKLKDPKLAPWQAWIENLPPRTTPKRATGFIFSEENRERAGVPKEWIHELKLAHQEP